MLDIDPVGPPASKTLFHYMMNQVYLNIVQHNLNIWLAFPPPSWCWLLQQILASQDEALTLEHNQLQGHGFHLREPIISMTTFSSQKRGNSLHKKIVCHVTPAKSDNYLHCCLTYKLTKGTQSFQLCFTQSWDLLRQCITNTFMTKIHRPCVWGVAP